MAEHKISAYFNQPIDVVNSDLEIVVKRNNKTFGTLTISKGSIDWRPTKKRIGGKNEVQLSWAKFDRRMREE